METSALFKDSYNGKLSVPLDTSLHQVIKEQTQAPIIRLCCTMGELLTIFIDSHWEYMHTICANGLKACLTAERKRLMYSLFSS